MSSTVPENTNLILVDTRTQNKTITLPPVASNPGRMLILKDYYGTSLNSTITIRTQGNDLLDDYNTTYTFSSRYGTLTLVCDGISSWRLMSLYNGALSLATSLSAINPATLLASGGSITLIYISPIGASITITFGTNTARINYYITSTPTIAGGAIAFVSGTIVTGGTFTFLGNFTIGVTYYGVIVPYNSAGNPGPQVASSGIVCVNFPSPPTNLSLIINSSTGIATISYTAGLDATTYFWTLYQGTTNDYTTGTVYSNGTTTNTSLTTPINGSGYLYYTIYSTNSVGTSTLAVSPITQSTYYSLVNTFTYTGADQLFTAPTGVTSVTVHLWGAGGAGDAQAPTAYGGAGAYVSGVLAVTPNSSYTVITGQGGIYNDAAGPDAYGGGGGALQNYGNESNGGGGGRSAIRNVANTADLVDAGGGGGGGGGYTEIYGGGAASWVGTANAGQGPYAGQGGSQGAGGQSGGQGLIGAFGYNSGGLYQGSKNNNDYAGGGGGGYYGGGGGGANNPRGSGPPGTSSGGGGGSSYTGGISNATGANSPNGYYTAPGQNITYYQTGVAQGNLTTGGNGLVVIIIGSPPPLPPKNLTFTISNGIGTLSWSAYSGASAYTWTLYQNTTNQYTGTVYSSGSTALISLTRSLLTGYCYYVTVTATVSGVTSSAATSSIINLLPVIGGSVTLSIVTGTGGTFTITAATNATSYNYYITTSSTSYASSLTSGNTSTTGSAVSFTTTLAISTAYYTIIVPLNGGVQGSQFVSNSAIVPVPIGGSVTLSSLSSTGGSITIIASTNATSYNYYITTSSTSYTSPIPAYSGTTIITGSAVLFTTTLTDSITYYTIVVPLNGGVGGTQFVSNSVTAIANPLYSLTNFTFTSAGVTGQNGPYSNQCISAYSGTSWVSNTAYFNMTTQGYQLWTVPFTTTYTVLVAGAACGSPNTSGYGYGQIIITTLNLRQGQKIQILVGQMGVTYDYNYSAGGGGSFIASGTTPATGVCLAAAGGGGGFYYTSGAAGQNGSTSTSGNASGDGTAGGTSGAGGLAPSGYGHGGAGFIGNGANSITGYSGVIAALSFQNGGVGGLDSGSAQQVGGFGGGGAINWGYGGGGGGGGYSGGGGGQSSYGGGGGSFPSGAVNVGLNQGDGYIVIYQLNYSSVPTGGSVTLSSFSLTGVILTIGAAINTICYNYYITTSLNTVPSVFSGLSSTPLAITITTILAPNTTYYGAIIPKNNQGSGSTVFSSAYVFPGITTVTLSNLTSTGGSLSWTASSLAIGYNWYIGTGYGTGIVASGITTLLTVNFTYSLINSYYYGWVQPYSASMTTGPKYYSQPLFYTTATGSLYSFTNFTFTNAGATGSLGPTLSQCTSVYSGTSWVTNTAYFNMTTQGYQLWTVPATGTYTIVCAGASTYLPSNGYGYGAIITTTVTLQIGQQIQILVGQMGVKYPAYSSSGGGGSFVATGITPISSSCIVAAGGGGGFYTSGTTGASAQNASITTSGNNSGDGILGGTAGGGGSAPNNYTQGGAGFTGNGANPKLNAGTSSFSFQNGGTGGITSTGYNGGFGGGGGINSSTGGGGGGGYSGGGGGGSYYGGGGGSFPSGSTLLGYNLGQGFVGIYTSMYSSVPTGGSATLSDFSATGVTLTVVASTNAFFYTYYLTTSSSSIASPLYTGTLTTATSITITIDIVAGTTYYAAIVPTNNAGSASAIFSSAYMVPGIAAPVALSALTTSGGTLSWTAASSAIVYNWYVGTSVGYTVLASGTTSSLTINFTTSLTSGTYYYGWVIPASSTVGIFGTYATGGIQLSGYASFTFVGYNQIYVVPTGVTSVYLTIAGAGGGGGGYAIGGAGALVQGYLAVTPGQTYYIIIGGGGKGSDGPVQSYISAFGGGGVANSKGVYAGNGGGRSAMQLTLGTDIVDAGAGGGSGAGEGGKGGANGTAGSYGLGLGGTQSSGGANYTGSNGILTNGYSSGGGGGGYYGGLTGNNDGGGGGSSLTSNLTGVTITTGGGGVGGGYYNTGGNGYITIVPT